MNETVAGAYVITLSDKITGRVLRTATVKLNSNEKTRPLRGIPITMIWDSSESYSDIMLDGDFLIRVSVPQSGM